LRRKNTRVWVIPVAYALAAAAMAMLRGYSTLLPARPLMNERRARSAEHHDKVLIEALVVDTAIRDGCTRSSPLRWLASYARNGGSRQVGLASRLRSCTLRPRESGLLP
jgi:hypothetical protein